MFDLPGLWLAAKSGLIKAGVLGALLAIAFGWGFQRGEDAGDKQRTEQALERERELNRAVGQALARGDTAVNALAQNEQRLSAERRTWKERLDANNDLALADARCPTVDAGGAPAAAGDGGGVVLSAAFLGLYNDAVCSAGTDDAAAACRAAAQAASAATAGAGITRPRAVLEHIAEQARTCGEDRRRYDRLLDLLPAVAAQFGTTGATP